MAITNEEIAALPIRALERITKRIVFELLDGKRFLIVGGKDRRPPPKGVAAFSPREMFLLLVNGIDEESFRKLILMKEMGIGESVVEVTTPTE